MRLLVLLLLSLLVLSGCDKLTGAADQQVADAEAIGFACRVSLKTPEDCMKENEAHRPSSILDGWKMADEDIKAGKLDPGMRGDKPAAALETAPEEATAAGETADTAAPTTEVPAGTPAPAGNPAPAPTTPAGK